MTRPAARCSWSSESPGWAFSASARTAETSSRSGNRLGSIRASLVRRGGGLCSPPLTRLRVSGYLREVVMAREAGRTSRSPDLEDLELHRAARSLDLDGLALLLADDRLPDRRFVRELVLGRVGLGRPDDPVLERLLGADVAQLHLRADGDDVLGDVLLRDHARAAESILERGDAVLEQGLLVLRVVVLGVLGDVAELTGGLDAVRDFAALLVREELDFLLELLVALGSKDYVLQNWPPERKNARR